MLPGIVTFILRSAAVGSLLGVVVAALFILSDVAGVGTLIRDSASPVPPVVLLLAGFAILFGSLYTGSAIMLLPRDKDNQVWRSIRYEPAHRLAQTAEDVGERRS
ncbi:MAG: hypothetical protein R3D57_20230 [Hyphomicrobiaceae bacterium]